MERPLAFDKGGMNKESMFLRSSKRHHMRVRGEWWCLQPKVRTERRRCGRYGERALASGPSPRVLVLRCCADAWHALFEVLTCWHVEHVNTI